ncbi:MAG: SGNH/GDSL hydrolase family protein [Rudaea sp.]|nr:SGNH/GDSL hydrolase family protein [Rudaea sp.]
MAQSFDHDGFLALGDSYTIGEGVAEEARWPVQLVALLHAHGVALAQPQIIARTGWTTDELSAAMDAGSLHPPYALVSLLIGVNNQYRGRDLENYRNEFRGLLERAIELAGKRPQRVIVVSIPDWGVTAFGRASGRDGARIAREIDAYNAANAQIAKTLHVRYADVTPASRDGSDHAEMLTADGLHPSAAMYRRWTELVLPQAQAALSSP